MDPEHVPAQHGGDAPPPRRAELAIALVVVAQAAGGGEDCCPSADAGGEDEGLNERDGVVRRHPVRGLDLAHGVAEADVDAEDELV